MTARAGNIASALPDATPAIRVGGTNLPGTQPPKKKVDQKAVERGLAESGQNVLGCWFMIWHDVGFIQQCSYF